MDIYTEIIISDLKRKERRENHSIFLSAGTQMTYTMTYRDIISVLFKGKLCSNTHPSGTVIKVILQITTALTVPVI